MISLTPIKCKEGEKVNFKCQVHAYPAAEILWKRIGNQQLDKNRFEIISNISLFYDLIINMIICNNSIFKIIIFNLYL